jgi:hypothetical protein
MGGSPAERWRSDAPLSTANRRRSVEEICTLYRTARLGAD